MALEKDPFAPVQSARREVETWIAAAGGDPAVVVPLPCAVFDEQLHPAGREPVERGWAERWARSWLGGPAVACEEAMPGGEWPRNRDGTPLAHVATFWLADIDAAREDPAQATFPVRPEAEALPDTGMLQIFHDLQTYGNAGDDPSGWRVVWSPEPPEDGPWPELVDGPEDLDLPSEATQAGDFQVGFTLPNPLDAEVAGGNFDAAEALVAQLQGTWQWGRFPRERTEEVPADWAEAHTLPFTHVYGWSSTGEAMPRDEILGEALPLEGEDRHVLLVDIESWTALNGWFGDAGHLEVWMRASDLAARRFEHAWCVIRTD